MSRLADGFIVDVNEAFLLAFGYTREEVVGHYAGELGIWRNFERDRASLVAQVRAQGFAQDAEAVFCTRSGKELRFLLGATRIESEEGPLLLIVGRNVSELRNSEMALRISEERYRGFIEHLPLGVMIAQEGLIRYANPASLEMIGFRLDEVLDRPFLHLVHEADRETVQEFHRRRMQGDDAAFCYDLRVLRKGGDSCYWRVHASSDIWEGSTASLVVCSDVTLQKLAEKEMTDLALHDPLTGLPNRLLLADKVRQAIANTAKGFCIVYLDLDGFKAINDNFGHEVGDRVLKEVAARLRGTTRESDTAARIGGDEFVVVVLDAGSDDKAVHVAGNILNAIKHPMSISGREHRVGASIGVSRFPVDGREIDELLSRADRAMYQAKRSGCNRICFFDRSAP